MRLYVRKTCWTHKLF